jgi:hypothetical protein
MVSARREAAHDMTYLVELVQIPICGNERVPSSRRLIDY